MSDVLCKMPWHSICLSANGDVKPCCLYSTHRRLNTEHPTIMENWNSQRIQDLRKAFLNGEKPTECKSCWDREEQIGYSRRIWFENNFGEYVTTPPSELVVKDPQILQADINLSNICNLKCRMCGSWASNKWFEEELILANKDNRYRKSKIPQQNRNVSVEDIRNMLPHLKDIKRIDFKGGEPMLAKHHNDFLQWMIGEDMTDVHLLYTTNGTVRNSRIIELFSKFKKVSLVFSIEGTGSRYNYIRGGEKYDLTHIEDNIAAYNELPNITIGFNVAVQNYNLLNIRDIRELLLSWEKKYKNASAIRAFASICSNPSYLSPFNIPDDLRDAALEQLSEVDDPYFKNICDSLKTREFNEDMWQTFLDFTRDLDALRGDNIVDHCPEFKKYFE